MTEAGYKVKFFGEEEVSLKVIAEAPVRTVCNRCEGQIGGAIVQYMEEGEKAGGMATLEFLILNVDVADRFRPGEVVLCTNCFEGVSVEEPKKIVVPEEL